MNKLPHARDESEIVKTWDRSKPLISIVCLTYNHASFLSEAVNGFLIQETTFPFEIVFHDDASTDETQALILELKERYPEIVRFVFQEKNIYSAAGNVLLHAIAACKGKYIAFCEGDDYWVDPRKLEKQASFLENNPTYVVTYSDCQPFDESGDVSFDFGGARRDLSPQELKEAPAIFTLTACFRNLLKIPPEAAMAKYGDLFMWSLLGHFGGGKYLPDIEKSRYRLHAGGVHSSASQESRLDMMVLTLSALFAYYRRTGDADLCKFYKTKLIELCFLGKLKRFAWFGLALKFKKRLRGVWIFSR